MYVLFREDLISSDDIKNEIQEKTLFKVETDLTKATKREDVMAFKLSIPTQDLVPGVKFDWDDNKLVEDLFSKAQALTKDFLAFFPKYTIQASSAYKWDEMEDRIYLVVVIANIDIRMKKLELDILKRMMKQVD
ncbi:MAG: hypothetical protein HXL18_02105 [Peptostreptococcus sp.]|jgi:hypothetical protein|uniref:hypothetical protein n=1 Tax=Peptostreptococcus sp. TaxID=1262 RepID=UPI001CAE401F|nr:hypothetical protein [Peptostreptococcus sp.]MBF1049925.1 hypothetical protein [Peptostreptococcus sp.]MBF1058089.1 hypothetical protein [Peptostreptococcus sp.]MBF1063519.1 hypothetical protein [Peptostreptococcus sp.]